ncbi:MAG: hypothetical protein JO301_09935 [Chitinophagaceae bacterium]|nr:hypothetical protein [Chitinophagaceae bacterium]
MINDDFISVAYSKSAAEWALKKSCDISNTILTVSVPLQNSLSRFGKTELFLPWTSGEYVTPSLDVDSKNLILFWGYINFRLDYDRINRMIDEVYRTNPEMKFLFVGPIGHSTRGDNTEKLDDVIANLREKKNVEFRPPSKLSDIEVDKVLAAIIPYRPNDPEIDAITISNKTFQLLSKGLPILISDLPAMPNFVNQEFVFRINPENVSDVVGKVKAGFGELQPAISKYVNENTSQMRMEQLVRYL